MNRPGFNRFRPQPRGPEVQRETPREQLAKRKNALLEKMKTQIEKGKGPRKMEWEQYRNDFEKDLASHEAALENTTAARSGLIYQEMDSVLKGYESAMERSEVDNQKEKLEEKYGITIETEKDISGEDDARMWPLSVAELRQNLQLLDEHLGVYPPQFLTNNNVQTIVLMKTVELKQGKEWRGAGGFSSVQKPGVLVLAQAYGLHGVLNRHADKADGSVADDDAAWVEAAYGKNDYAKLYSYQNKKGQPHEPLKTYQELLRKHGNNRPIGFAHLYGMVDIDYDQLTIAVAMLQSPAHYRALKQQAELDSRQRKTQFSNDALLRKMELTRKSYEVKSGGLMDEQFWKDFESGVTINQAYWKKREAQE